MCTITEDRADSKKIAKENRIFFCTDLAMRMFDESFETSVVSSFDGPVKYGFDYNLNLTGYILVDATDIKKNGLTNNFIRCVHRGMLQELSVKIKQNLGGELNDEVLICLGLYRFQFRISKYETLENDESVFVDDHSDVSGEESLGRFVDLKITRNKLK